MTPGLHRRIVGTAKRVSRPLGEAIARVGRVAMPKRDRRGLACFLARVVVGQQLSTSAARSIWARLEALVAERGSSMPEFFTARNSRALRGCGISNAKVRALIALREADTAGRLSVAKLRRMTHTERAEHLQAIWGVGQWTADMTSIFYFGDCDVWPAGDLGVYRGMEKCTGRRSKKKILEIANAFAPYRSFLALYMWRVLEEPKRMRARAASKQPV